MVENSTIGVHHDHFLIDRLDLDVDDDADSFVNLKLRTIRVIGRLNSDETSGLLEETNVTDEAQVKSEIFLTQAQCQDYYRLAREDTKLLHDSCNNPQCSNRVHQICREEPWIFYDDDSVYYLD